MKIILGGPGCGKTSRLLELMEQELSSGVKPEQIGFVAFTRKAANEARDRAMAKFELGKDDLPYFRTLHSLAFRQLGLNKEEVMSPEDYQTLGATMCVQFGKQEDEFGLPTGSSKGDHMSYVDQICRLMKQPLEVVCDALQLPVSVWEVMDYRVNLAEYKQARNVVDFTDMLEYYAESGPFPSLAVLFVDEAQDLSRLQWQVTNKLIACSERVYIAGDDDQAIYEWSGADVKTFLHLQGDVEVLPVSHRLPRLIFDKANEILNQISERYAKQWSPASEGGIIERYLSTDDVDYSSGSWLLLARNRYMLSDFVRVLREHGHPYLLFGKSSVNEEAVTALLRWEFLRGGGALKPDEVRELYAKLRLEGVHKKHKSFTARNDQMYTHEELVRDHGLLIPKDEDWMTAVRFPPEDREYYRAIKRRGISLKEKPRIIVSTIHQVKGGEADHVALKTDMSNSCYRNLTDNPDSEHRVFYVGATRAKKSLHIIYPRTSKFYTL